jgi:hypothetical protein
MSPTSQAKTGSPPSPTASFGRVLEVNLSTGEARRWQVPAETLRLYIGGRGLGARLLLDILPAHTDPLSPANVLMFAFVKRATSGDTALRAREITRRGAS